MDEAADAANNVGRTCLHIAAMTGNAPLITLLVKQYGAKVNVYMNHKVNGWRLHFCLVK